MVEAMRYDGTNSAEVCMWSDGNAIDVMTLDEPDKYCLAIRTLEGVMYAGVGDYIIKGIKGEFYPCKPDVFDATYELM